MSLARFPISDIELRGVVHDFYAEIRRHPVLGPVFAAHVRDWPEHEEKIIAFWRNAILPGESKDGRRYDGNPMAVHKAAGNVRAGMFIPWLRLFDTVLQRRLPPETASAWSALAHRIGRGLSLGLQDFGGIPKLK
ncbi:group III truncated hemoglobin [Xinfangfangia sp. D13-10-4-6]|uniref:group III truncated hemoglobin n=1 Tax=Pseudogemmobacter hezensis TaxID=2737662 RepID=UPI001553BE80|nr:group III truncated hemoglobin [Pseudogemmobacter hezensis]NPD15469.1 group III truncated hemoglobin [Pseudogemmobacter hezensis]